MDQSSPILVRGRCACGRRYRIRNARAGVMVRCPNCQRAITLTEADLRAAAAGARLMPLQAEEVEPPEAILVDQPVLRLAPPGSRPGLTGRKAPDHDEALLARAVRGRPPGTQYDEQAAEAAGPGAVLVELESPGWAFLHDLLASFYFAGIPRNALNVLLIAATCWLLSLLPYALIVLGPLLQAVLSLVLAAVVGLYVVQFYWSVLRMTAGGEDEIPWVQSDWSWWEDSLKPLVWLGVISAACSVPAMVVKWYGLPDLGGRVPAWWPALAAGWFFWPVAVMSVALGQTLLFCRPDWLVRCIFKIGPVYFVAWLAVMLALAALLGHLILGGAWTWVPLLGFAINLYLGYVVFRILGLLFRHFRQRFPWKF